MNDVTLHHGDCLEVMKVLSCGIVDLTVTSPPYDDLRTYNGNNEQWGEHVWKAVIKELHRLTTQGGVVVWVVGDATVKGSETGTSFKQALWAKECGFNLHDTMIYKKKNPIPLTHNRYEQSFEYMFIFSKGKPKAFNPLKIPCTTSGVYTHRRKSGRVAESGMRSRGEKTQTSGHKISANICEYAVGTKRNNGNHPAPFPEELANDHIVSWSNEGDIIFDPFMGSGTTGLACKNLNRKFIGIEKDKGYFDIAGKRINEVKPQVEMMV